MADSLIIPSIAARKAARKRNQYQSEVASETVHASDQPQSTESSPVLAPETVSERGQTLTSESLLSPVVAQAPAQSVRTPTPSSEVLEFSKELLLKLAKQHGLNLAPEKREFTKHTYSITPDRKERMKEYTYVLSMNMQDAVCEAFDLFFTHHKERFETILQARGNS